MTSAALLLWALYPEEPNLTGNAGYQKEDPGYYPGGSDCYPSNLMRLTGREGAEAAIACNDAREQHRLNTNDLIQQRRSADAADAMAVLAYKQTWVAAWGAVFGFLTLCAAVAAAIYAGVAAAAAKSALVHADNAVKAGQSAADAGWQTVTQAKKSTIAAQDAARTAQVALDFQRRPWLSFEVESNAKVWRQPQGTAQVGLSVSVQNISGGAAYYYIAFDFYGDETLIKGGNNADSARRKMAEGLTQYVIFPGERKTFNHGVGGATFRITSSEEDPPSEVIDIGGEVFVTVVYRGVEGGPVYETGRIGHWSIEVARDDFVAQSWGGQEVWFSQQEITVAT